MRKIFKFLICIFILIALAFCIFFIDRKAVRNDDLLHEVKALSAASSTWKKLAAKDPSLLLDQSINGRKGNLILLDKFILVDGAEKEATLAWTNSSFGIGTLIVTTDKTALWLSTNGDMRKLNLPEWNHISFWWYLTNP